MTIFANGGTVGITNTVIVSHVLALYVVSGTVRENHNLYFGNTSNFLILDGGALIEGGGSQIGDPDFVDADGDDYHLGPSSAALNLGVNTGITTDFEGDPRPFMGGFDAGFDERFLIFDERLFVPLIRR